MLFTKIIFCEQKEIKKNLRVFNLVISESDQMAILFWLKNFSLQSFKHFSDCTRTQSLIKTDLDEDRVFKISSKHIKAEGTNEKNMKNRSAQTGQRVKRWENKARKSKKEKVLQFREEKNS